MPSDLKLVHRAQRTRKILLNLKCLFWCLHQMQTRYDLNLVLQSLERRSVHREISDSNLGDNVAFLIDHFELGDLQRLSAAIQHLPESISTMDIEEKHFEIGHYIQSLEDFGPIKAETYGVISRISPQLRGLFLLDGEHLIDTPIPPASTQTIFGTYIV